MTESNGSSQRYQPPEGGIGGEGAAFDLTVLAPETDHEIAEGVRAAFHLDLDVQTDHFAVRVKDGVVHLEARGASAEESQRAVRLARGVHGVRDVTGLDDSSEPFT